MTEPKNTARPPKRVLIADDEHLMATGLASSMRSLGYDIVGPASSGQEALDLAKAERPDLALLDIRMPDIDGLVVAGVLWHELAVPVIIVSAFSDSDYTERSKELGVFGYLLKPVSTENLRVTLAIAWARAREHENQRKRIHQLENTLSNRKIVEQAKWSLIERENLSEPDAHARLQRAARNNRRPLVEVAKDVLRDAGLIDDNDANGEPTTASSSTTE